MLLSLYSSCTKIQTTDVGSGLIPTIDGVNTKDTTLDLITTTFLEDQITRVYKGDEHVIGTISNDPIFGKTTASAFFELKPSFFNYFFSGKKNEIRADSAVLVLSYKGVYGDTLIPQTWRVFEIATRDTLRYDSAYGAQTTNINTTTQLGVKSFDIRSLKDSVKNKFEASANQIRIKLDPSFARRLINDYDSSNQYKSNEEFRKNFAGFAVVPDQGQGNALVRINLVDTNTKLALYYTYKTAETTPKDTSVVNYFRFITAAGTNTSGSANVIRRDYIGSEVAASIASNRTDVAYVQTSPGSYVRIRVPGFSTFPNSLIHRAELIAEQNPQGPSDNTFGPPRYLLLAAYDSVNKIKRNIRGDYIIDNSSGVNNIANFGGFLSYKTVNNTSVASYDFNITRYVQGIVTRKDTSFTLRLSAPSNDSLRYTEPYPSTFSSIYYINPNLANNVANGRVRLGGGAGDRTRPYRMRLRIIYSTL
jgi:hypothetical protein